MGDSLTDYVQTGLWTDHSQRWGHRWQYLVTQFHADVITNILGILVPIAGARLFRILLRGLELLGMFRNEPRAPESLAWSNIRRGLDLLGQGSIRLGPQQPVPAARRREGPRYLAMGVGLILIFCGFLAGGVATAYIATDNTALSKHPKCGLYMAEGPTWLDLLNISRPYETNAQAESGTLADSCLNRPNPDCGNFPIPAFPVIVENYTCPFEKHMCYGQGVNPIRISTGAVSARKIGINSPKLLEFNRTTVCSPLNMNRTYVNLARQEGNTYHFGYYYGQSTEFDTASYETVRRGDRGDVPTYEVSALWSDGSLAWTTPWKPLKSLLPEPGSTTTLVIIVSQKVNYLTKRLDPVFPAEDTTSIPGDPRTYYINLSGPGTVLACMDRTEYRDHSTDPSWYPLSKLPTSGVRESGNTPALFLLGNSLAGSNIYGSMNLRLAAALDAQSRISGFVSLPLAEEQWKSEARRLFNVSLARIMINARDISRGTKSDYYGFMKLPPVRPDICHETYIMHNTGWRNINFTGMLCLLGFPMVVILLSIPYTRLTPNGEEELLSIEDLCVGLLVIGKRLVKLAIDVAHLGQKLWQYLPTWITVKTALSRMLHL